MEQFENREKMIYKAGIVGIGVNALLAVIKLIISSITGSVAIASDAVNNISDGASSVITILGSKLAAKDPDDKHPYGHGRIEYITGLIISIIVIVVGIEFLKTSVLAIIHPKEVNFTWVSVIIMTITIFAKILLSLYNKKQGKKANSPALIASGADAMGDAAVTSITVIAAIISLFTKFRIDGYVGVIVSGFILYSGIQLVTEIFHDIIGKRGDRNLANKIYSEIKKTPMVQGAYDLVLHNYGPNRYLGSVNVEIEDTYTVREVTEILNPVQERLMEMFDIYFSFGIYAVNTTDEKIIASRKKVLKILRQWPEILNMHAFFINEERKTIRFDIVVTFKLKNSKKLKEDISSEVQREFPNYKTNIKIDHRFV
ncbi:MAG: cation diffusion facilitator family transporter [Lachnospiraceae bacterium]|nr:cation diffusion facilitator family transporter [Lachnospiraceae bacterium]